MSNFNEMIKKPYFIYYKIDDEAMAWNSEDNTINKVSMDVVYSDKYKNYAMMKKAGYPSTKEGLQDFVNAFHKYQKELEDNDILCINWFQYRNNNGAVLLTYNRLANKKNEKPINHEHIGKIESLWMLKCYRAGIRTIDDKYLNKRVMSYSYDFRLCHPTCLSHRHLLIPTKSGKEITLSQLPDINNIETGYYHVDIQCNDPQFRKLFSFSDENVYTDRSLYHAMKHQQEFNVKINIIQDGHPNAYTYDKSCLVSGKRLFGNWFSYMIKLKKRFKSNFLVKFLASSLSGQLSKSKYVWKTEEEVEKENIKFDLSRNEKYYLINYLPDTGKFKFGVSEDPFVNNIRFKPFMTAFMRNKVARVAFTDLKHCFRVFEDSISFIKPQTFNLVDLVSEEKTSGLCIYSSTVKQKGSDELFQYIKEHDKEFYNALVTITSLKTY